jgi:hypothetical protein
MSAMRRDHHVTFRREETLESAALRLRCDAGLQNRPTFNIVDFIKGFLSKALREKGPFKIELFDQGPGEPAAYVTFNPLTLHVDNEVWERADMGDPEATFILAHEIGHLILHNHFAKAFSNNSEDRIKFAEKEYSAEWQANTFASYFLLPTHIVEAFGNAQELARSCGVTHQMAEDRVKAVRATSCRSAIFEGEACSNCGNFTLLRRGTSLTCTTCWRRSFERIGSDQRQA